MPTIEGRESVLALQFSTPTDPGISLDSFIAQVIASTLDSARHRPKRGQEWIFFAGLHEHAELPNWLGISSSVPSSVTDALQRALGAQGCATHREYAQVGAHSLRPLLAVTPAGIIVPSEESSGIDAPTLALLAPYTRASFTVELTRSMHTAIVNQHLLGSPTRPLVFPFFAQDPFATLHFGRMSVDSLMIDRDRLMTAAVRLSRTPPCILMFDFTRAHVAALPARTHDHLDALTPGALYDVPEGDFVVGIVARPAAPELLEAAAFVVERFVPADTPRIVAVF